MFDLNTSILDAEYGEELDEQRLYEYIDAVMNEFADSPEGSGFCEQYDTSLGYAAWYMDYLTQYHGVTPAAVSIPESQDVVFEVFPRKVSVESDAAEEIIAELRAFWLFLKRTRNVPQADEMLESFGEEAADRLEAELADESNFGMAKSFFTAGKAAGFDMSTQEGLNAFMAIYNAGLLMDPESANVDEEPDEEDYAPVTVAPIRSETAKVGRNEKCPCGSGRKFKKCCGRN